MYGIWYILYCQHLTLQILVLNRLLLRTFIDYFRLGKLAYSFQAVFVKYFMARVKTMSSSGLRVQTLSELLLDSTPQSFPSRPLGQQTVPISSWMQMSYLTYPSVWVTGKSALVSFILLIHVFNMKYLRYERFIWPLCNFIWLPLQAVCTNLSYYRLSSSP